MIYGQNILNDGYHYKVRNTFNDIGENWESITFFGASILDKHFQLNITPSDSSKKINTRFVYQTNPLDLKLNCFNYFNLKNHFYAYINPILSAQKTNFQIDVSGFGYRNDWLQLHIDSFLISDIGLYGSEEEKWRYIYFCMKYLKSECVLTYSSAVRLVGKETIDYFIDEIG